MEENWKETAQKVSSTKVKPSESGLPKEDDPELKAAIAAARIKMDRGSERTSVPITEVAALKLAGWVISAEQ